MIHLSVEFTGLASLSLATRYTILLPRNRN